MNPDNDNHDIQQTAVINRAADGMYNVARLVANYYHSLIELGVDQTTAGTLALHYQNHLFAGVKKG